MGQDFAFFLGILLVIFAVWVGSGGPSSPITFSGPYLGASSTSQFVGFTPVVGGSTLSSGSSSYSGNISLGRDSQGAKSEDADTEYVVIRMSNTAGEGVSLAGWNLASADGKKRVPLPAATVLPTSGKVNQSGPLTLMPGEDAIVITGRSPVGISFKENVCTGYFEDHQDFIPSLSQSCPSPIQEFARFYTNEDEGDECVAYVRTLPACKAQSRAPSSLDASCEAFIEKEFSYNGCVARHQGDPAFYGYTWRLFLGQGNDLWGDSHDTVLLLDGNGKTVDALSY